jgi:hypothetical protein
MDVSQFQDGLYFVHISLQDQTSITKKLVITN